MMAKLLQGLSVFKKDMPFVARQIAAPREKLESITIFDEEFLYSPSTVLTKNVDGEPTRAPQLPVHINSLVRFQNGENQDLESMVKSMGNEALLALVRANALEQDGHWGKIYTSNRQPYGTYSICGDGIFINEDWANDRAVDCDGDAGALFDKIDGLKLHQIDALKDMDRPCIFGKYPFTKELPILSFFQKKHDIYLDVNLESLKENSKWVDEAVVVWSKERKSEAFRKKHTQAKIGIITNSLLHEDLAKTAGMRFREKAAALPTLNEDLRFHMIERPMQEARNGASFGEKSLGKDSLFISGEMAVLTGIKGISSGKIDSAWVWEDNWVETASRVLALDVYPEEIQIRKGSDPLPKREGRIVDAKLVDRLHDTGILQFQLLETEVYDKDGNMLPAAVVWLHGVNNTPVALIDTKRNESSESEFESYAAVIFPTWDEDCGKWLNPIDHMKKWFFVYADEEGYYSESGFNGVWSGGFFPANKQGLKKLPYKSEELRKAVSYYVSKFGTSVSTKFVRVKNRIAPVLAPHTAQRIAKVVCVHYTDSYGDVEKMELEAMRAYRKVKFAYYAYKPKDSPVKLYFIEKEGRPAIGLPGGNYERYGAVRQVLIGSESVEYRIALVHNMHSKQQMYLTPSGLAKTPEYRGNNQLLNTYEQYKYYCANIGVEECDEDRHEFETLSGEKRYVWVVNPKATVTYPKFITPDGIKSFSCGCDHVYDLNDEPIDALLPIDEVVAKGLYHAWMKKAVLTTIIINGKEVEAYIVKRKLIRSCDASENSPSGWKRSYARGAWERILMYRTILQLDGSWRPSHPNYDYIKELRRTRDWLISNHSRIVIENTKKAEEFLAKLATAQKAANEMYGNSNPLFEESYYDSLINL